MSSLYLKGVKLINPSSEFHLKKVHLSIKNGKIDYLGLKETTSAGKVIEGKDLVVTPGWFDLRANFCDPGMEHKEDLTSGLKAAAAGGFTDVCLLPDTHPTIQTKNDIEYLKSKGRGKVTTVHPMAAVTLGRKGEELSEMIDLHYAGAAAFTDGHDPIWNTDILLKTLQYLQPLHGVLMNRAEDKWLAKFGVMHEGVQSTRLGMRGVPVAGETIMVERDLRILEYAGGKIHFSLVSSAEAVDMIKKAKKRGLSVTCDVSAHHLCFNDTYLSTFDTNYKVSPPFRTEKDRKALIAGVKDGTIDAIVSAHEPQDEESKKLEFDLAEFGITGLQTLWPVLNQLDLKGELSLEQSLPAVFAGPRKVLGLEPVALEVGADACLTVVDTSAKWTFDKKTNLSKSINNPFFGKELTGMVAAVSNNGLVQTTN
ncbi:MAG: dihydroorotase [Imperialibacter sp.]|uniref:dihydroorotase n=1 Tax=Imperialibacter sp. TaxID=2038411 RepID=UPI0032EC4177